MTKTPFELDMDEQPAALRKVASTALTEDVAKALGRTWQRIVLTGMGSSYFAAHPTWRHLASKGIPAWNMDAGMLLDTPGLLDGNTLVIAISQSGASGEIVELLDRRAQGAIRCGSILGVTANCNSPLASKADAYVDIVSGSEATVSTKSYLNTLASLYKMRNLLLGGNGAGVEAEILEVAEAVEGTLSANNFEQVAGQALATTAYRLATVAKGSDIATAYYAALITKESAKVSIEGYAGGEFRHGPFELSGAGMTAFFYGLDEGPDHEVSRRLINDTLATGADVVTIGRRKLEGARHLPARGDTELMKLATGGVIAQKIAVAMARANAVEPGTFVYGQKVTSSF